MDLKYKERRGWLNAVLSFSIPYSLYMMSVSKFKIKFTVLYDEGVNFERKYAV